MKIRKSYYNAIQKYGTKKVLEMYRDNKIELNDKEWKNLHKRIDKENKQYFGFKLESFIAVVICLLAILVVSIFANVDNYEKIKKCNEMKGHTCSRYEIESLGD